MARFQGYPKISSISDQGVYAEYNYTNTPVLPQTFQFLDFAFIGSKTFCVHETSGLYSFNGSTWNSEVAIDDGSSIFSEQDTIWVPRNNSQNCLKWESGTVNYLPNSFKKIAAKNGVYWVKTSDYTGIKSFREGVVSMPYSPDTSMILSWNNYDFKFAKNSDSLFVASDKGLSIAANWSFVDSITPGNSLNMPSAGIIEFEFDSQDNIWAIFQSDHLSDPTHVGYYNRINNTWEQVYDAVNSPIDFNYELTLEIDSSDNVWLSNGFNLYVLKINNWPSWLGQNELSFNQQKELIGVYDVLGRETEEKPNTVLIYVYSDGTSKKVFRLE